MAKDKDIWDILSSISMLISGGLIAAVGVIATIIYDNRQLKLAQIEALDKYRVQLLSDNPAERVFSYEAFVALGYAELAAKLIAVRNDPAGESVLVQLAENPDSKVREIAKQGLLSLDDQRRIRSIVDVFETGTDQINYGYLETIPGKTVGLIYGRGQATRGSGELYKLIEEYISNSSAVYKDEFGQYMSLLKNRDQSLDKDEDFMYLLKKAGDDPVMREAQDKQFERLIIGPTLKLAKSLGIETPLGIAVVHDSRIHGSFPHLRKQTEEELGGTPRTGVGEEEWIKRYVEIRHEWLSNHNIPIIRKTNYRTTFFLRMIEEKNWQLRPPLNIGSVQVD